MEKIDISLFIELKPNNVCVFSKLCGRLRRLWSMEFVVNLLKYNQYKTSVDIHDKIMA